jgi:5-oxoprolinase (ATP-hydrolysing) subunit C
LGFARGGLFSYLAIEGGIAGEPVFGSMAVNARAGLGSPYPRPLQAGDELQVTAASGTAEQRIELPAPPKAPIRVVLGPQDDEFADEQKYLFLDSEWKISATSDRMGYRLEGPAIKHLHGHNIVSDGTVSGSIQVPGNGAPIVLMPDRGTSGGYPKIATVISADHGRFAQISAGTGFHFKAVTMVEAQAEARKFAELLRTLPDRLRAIENFDLNIEALQDANVAGAAVSAIDARTWQVLSPADALTQD